MPDPQDTAQSVVEAVRGALGANAGEMATRVVVIAETMDADGQVALWSATDDDSKSWQTLGLLMWAVQREQAGIVKDFGGTDA